MKSIGKYAFATLCLLMTLASAGQAFAWWNPDWQHRVKINFDTSPAGANLAGLLQEVPMLIRLHTGNFDFTKAKEDGADLRFVGADDKEQLKHHFESYDPSAEMALVWVKVPGLDAKGPSSIFLYYGNDKAVQSENIGGTYDVGQTAVFHFNETKGMPVDSTAYQNNALQFQGGQGLPAQIGRGLNLAGAQDRLVLPGKAFKLDNGFTFSTWLRLARSQANAPLLTCIKEGKGLRVTLAGATVQASLTSGGKNYQTAFAGNLTMDTWHHLAVAGASGGDLTVYVDGNAVASVKLPQGLPDLGAEPVIGGGETGGAFVGDLDEVELSNLTRTPDWIMATARSQAPGAAVVTAAPVEENTEGGGEGSAYFSTIAKNITVDGWVVMAFMAVLSAATWIIMIGKSYFYYHLNRENRHFQQVFNRLTEHQSLEGRDQEFVNSPLYVIYQDGYRMMHEDHPKNPSVELSRASATGQEKTFLFIIDKCYLNEVKKLNSWLFILTLAVSGGPFLGLLGTVWGVMNTFAAMAQAGEASLLAIAPGIASALACTIMGLLVALPALFGHNYLTGVVRGLTQDMNVFLEEYALKVDKFYWSDVK